MLVSERKTNHSRPEPSCYCDVSSVYSLSPLACNMSIE